MTIDQTGESIQKFNFTEPDEGTNTCSGALYRFRLVVAGIIMKKRVDGLRNDPTTFNYAKLTADIKSGDWWMRAFLKAGGLEALMEELKSSNKSVRIHLQMDYLMCITTILNYITAVQAVPEESASFRDSFVEALQTDREPMKQQMFLILSTLCSYSKEGLRFTLDVLEYFKTVTNHVFNFHVIVHELHTAKQDSYKIELMTCMSSILAAAEDLEMRIRLRNELIGLKLRDVFKTIRSGDNEELKKKCDLFEDEEEADNFDFNILHPPDAAFYTFFSRDSQGPCVDYITMLHTLMLLDPKKSDSDKRWEKAISALQKAICLPSPKVVDTEPGNSKLADRILCDDCGFSAPMVTDHENTESGGGPPDAPPLPPLGLAIPSNKLMTLHWDKVPDKIISDFGNIWAQVTTIDDHIPVNRSTLERLFSKKHTAQKRQTKTKVRPLGENRSMQVDILLQHIKKDNDTIVSLIEEGNMNVLGEEHVRGLQKILPTAEELEKIQDFEGDLTNAEQFCQTLNQLDNFQMRLDCMVLQLDLTPFLDIMKHVIDKNIRTSSTMMNNKSLKRFLLFMLETGNTMNEGKGQGSAKGFKISSLNKLKDTQASEPGVTLLHHLLTETEKHNLKTLTFVDVLLPDLSYVCRYAIDELKPQLTENIKKINALNEQLTGASQDAIEQYQNFIKDSSKQLEEIKSLGLRKVTDVSRELAKYFCEDRQEFDLQSFFKEFKSFCEQIQTCQKENLAIKAEKKTTSASGKMKKKGEEIF